jgi:hypothetical protein
MWRQHGVDIEATIKNGKLAVGVFAPTQLLALEQGERLVENLRVRIEKLGVA